jgi:hypothetical protein
MARTSAEPAAINRAVAAEFDGGTPPPWSA